MQPPASPVSAARAAHPIRLGRYVLYDAIAAGGMATVHIGRLIGPVGFSRTVAVKRLHEHLAQDPQFVMMFLDEARLAARIRHPNVVPTLDVVSTEGQLFVVMEYVQGDSLSRFLRRCVERHERPPPPVIVAIMCAALEGLHAAHEARDERGLPLGLVHRDVSPQNILVGVDGVARVVDFGIAKAAGRVQTTRTGEVKGKLAYMAPEQVRGAAVDRRTDLFAASVVLWETLTCRRLYEGDNDAQVLAKVMGGGAEAPSRVVPGLGEAFDAVVGRGLSVDPAKRFATAREMAIALGDCAPAAQAFRVAAWVDSLAADSLATRARLVSEIESQSSSLRLPPSVPPAPGSAPMLAAAAAMEAPSTVLSTTTSQRNAIPFAPHVPRAAWMAGAVGAVAGLVALVVIATSMRSKPARSSAPPTAATPSVIASAADPASGSAPTAAPLETPPPPAASSVASRDARPRPTATVARSAPQPPAPVPTAKPAKPGCDPPYSIDAHGVKHYLPQCFE